MNLLRIAVYDADKEENALISSTIKDILIKARCSFELSSYYASQKIISNIEENSHIYEILLLDAEDDASLSIARKLRAGNMESAIIFTSNGKTPLIQLLKYRPTALITDMTNPRNIFSAFRDAYLEIKNISSHFVIKTKERIVKVYHKDIDYFDNYQRVVTLYNRNRKESIEFYARFEDVYNMLPKDVFIRCHQSFIVNMEAVKALDKVNRRFILTSGGMVDISKRMLPEVVEAFQVYITMRS